MTGIMNIFLANTGDSAIQLGLGISNLDTFFYNSSSLGGATGPFAGISMGPDGDFWNPDVNDNTSVYYTP